MNPFKGGNLTTGIVVGVGACFLAPLAMRVLSGAGKPILREGIKGGLCIFNKGQTMLAEMKETFEDLSAEARSELEQSKQVPATTEK